MSNNSIKQLKHAKKKRFFFSIRSKMNLYFGLMFVIIWMVVNLFEMYGIPFTKYGGEISQHKSITFKQLNLVADLKKERLLRWIEERKDDAAVLSNSGITMFYVSKILQLIRENVVSDKKNYKIWAELQGEKMIQDLTQHLNLVKLTYGVYDLIQITDASTGLIIASTNKDDLGMDISGSNLFSETLHKSFNNEIINVYKDQLSNNLKLSISRTINIDDNKVAAVLIMHINPNDFIKPMLHVGLGLGESGEVLL